MYKIFLGQSREAKAEKLLEELEKTSQPSEDETRDHHRRGKIHVVESWTEDETISIAR
jgi:hypothetical protein